MIKKIFQSKKNTKNERGFTVIELTVVMGIMAVMSTIVIFNFNSFDARLQFDNLAQDIALRVVQAQKSAMSGVLNPDFPGRDTKPAYGVYFAASPSASAASESFTYFTDIPTTGTTTGDKIYNPPVGIFTCNGLTTIGNECLSVTGITTGEYVSNICYKTDSGVDCTNSSGGDLNVVFIRPFSDASIIIHKPITSTSPIYAQSACIGVSSPRDPGQSRTIMISSIGQISIYSVPATSTTLGCQIWP